MRPFDPRLPRRVPATRRHLAALAVLGVVAGTIVISQATALATLLAAAAQGRLDRGALVAFLTAVGARSGWTWLSGVVTARSAATVKASLRAELFEAVGRRGPGWVAGQRAGEIATLAGRGLDALDPYFTGYLPQLVLSVTVPVAVLARLVLADWPSALVVALTLPLIPIFGALVGWQTRTATERQWRRLSRLGGHFLDMVAGLPTLRAFGRARAQVDVVRRMADGHRVATMRTLRIAFLSALVLELVATVAVALVAVPIGLRLLTGGLTLQTALLVLLLTPEAFSPLRTAGTKFHASVEGLTALDDAFTVLQSAPDAASPPPVAAGPPAPDAGTPATSAPRGRRGAPATAPAPADRGSGGVEDTAIRAGARDGAPPPALAREIRLEHVTVAYDRTVALRDVSLTVAAGERLAIIGPSGAGKSTLLALLLGFVPPTSGRVLVDGVDLATVDIEAWRQRLAWVPQRPHLFAESLADNIRLGAPHAPLERVRTAASAAALDEVVAGLPDGLDTMLGEGGLGLSSGQRQRVALARAFLRDGPLVLLDEPTARLDTASEAVVLAAAARLVAGRTALLVAHRPALLPLADRVVRVADGRLTGYPRTVPLPAPPRPLRSEVTS